MISHRLIDRVFSRCIAPPASDALGFLSAAQQSELQELLTSIYGPRILFSKPKIAQSIIWRSDREFLGEVEDRFVQRVHVYEERSNGGPRYVGFVHLRPEPVRGADREATTFPRTCEAYLRPPEGYVRSPCITSASGAYGIHYGLIPFECVPYVTPHPSMGGHCAQACVFMASVLSRAGKPVTPFEATFLAARELESDGSGTPSIPVDGLTTSQIAAILSQQEVEACPVHEVISLHDIGGGKISEESVEIFAEVVQNYLYQGMPVIYAVDYGALYGRARGEDFHTIVLVGIRRQQPGHRNPVFVYMDPTEGPFLVASANELAAARYQLKDEEGNIDASAHLIACVAPGMDCHFVKTERDLRIKKFYVPIKSEKHRWLLRHRHQLPRYLLCVTFGACYNMETRGLREAYVQQVGAFLKLDLPEYVWILEKSLRDQRGSPMEGIVLDASSPDVELGRYYHNRMIRITDGKSELTCVYDPSSEEEYPSVQLRE